MKIEAEDMILFEEYLVTLSSNECVRLHDWNIKNKKLRLKEIRKEKKSNYKKNTPN